MKAKEVSYRRVFSLGDFQTETYSVTVELQDSTDVQEAIEFARTTIEEAHAKVMGERAKPERVEKIKDDRIEITWLSLKAMEQAIKAGKVSREYLYDNYKFNDTIKVELEKLLRQFDK